MNYSNNMEGYKTTKIPMNKKIKILIATVLLFTVTLVHAQKINHQGKVYEVKKDRIFLKGKDISQTLSATEASAIKDALRHKVTLEKVQAEKKKIEKKLKAAEKEQRKTAIQAKKRAKTQAKLAKHQDKLRKETKKFETLKDKGRLSPIDEKKWLKKLDKYKVRVQKAEKKARKY